MNPTVTFIVPCYKLAHLLPECVNSILSQTYTDFEVLIMDDCSPDNTPEVARSFSDPRVRHIRNDPNLGHLRNYNKGIAMARGKYIWLISADDCLRWPSALAEYVQVLDSCPKVGYVFSPAVNLENGQRTGVLKYSVHGNRDTVFSGQRFLARLIRENTIVAPSVLVRRKCYEQVAVFPLDMPWGGDWYLWCIFALHYDVGYLAEAHVCYRRHGLSMTALLTTSDLRACVEDDVRMPWLIKRVAEALGYKSLVRECLRSAAHEYARSIASKRYRTSADSMTLEQFEESLSQNTSSNAESRWVRAHLYRRMAKLYRWQGDLISARMFNSRALTERFWMPEVWLERLLLLPGDWGIETLKSIRAGLRLISGAKVGR